jgi:Zn-finger nucleic acid-binding protein
LNCPNCGAPLQVAGPGSYLYCRYCSSLFFPKDAKDGVNIVGVESEYHCPVCHDLLVAAEVASEPVLYSQRCHGMLLKQGIFADVVRYLGERAPDSYGPARALNRDDLRRPLHCPHCGRLMQTHPYYGPGNIVIDMCMPCRLVWLDGGELNAIVNAPGWNRRADD